MTAAFDKERLLAALAPFACAYRQPIGGAADAGFQAFLDRNTITPRVTMGDFRRAAEAYVSNGGRLPQVQYVHEEPDRVTDTDAGVAAVARSSSPKRHVLKTDPEKLEEQKAGRKRHEVRVFDRDFQVGDTILLQGFDRAEQTYTGDEALVAITYITEPGTYGLPANVGVLSTSLVL